MSEEYATAIAGRFTKAFKEAFKTMKRRREEEKMKRYGTYDILSDDARLQVGDVTGVYSLIDQEGLSEIEATDVGRTVAEVKLGDMDAKERIYARRNDRVWTRREQDSDRVVEYERDARMGSPKSRAQNAVVVRCSTFVGTLGPAHGWEHHEYPYVRLTLALPEGATDLQRKLARELRDFADRFIAANGLEPKRGGSDGST